MSMDFPRGWQIAKETRMRDHERMCSYRQSKGGFLCDCRVITQHPEYTDDVLHTLDGVPFENPKRNEHE